MDARIVKPGRTNSRKFSRVDFNFAFNALPAAPFPFSLALYGF